jgi:hypothetical protein
MERLRRPVNVYMDGVYMDGMASTWNGMDSSLMFNMRVADASYGTQRNTCMEARLLNMVDVRRSNAMDGICLLKIFLFFRHGWRRCSAMDGDVLRPWKAYWIPDQLLM